MSWHRIAVAGHVPRSLTGRQPAAIDRHRAMAVGVSACQAARVSVSGGACQRVGRRVSVGEQPTRRTTLIHYVICDVRSLCTHANRFFVWEVVSCLLDSADR